MNYINIPLPKGLINNNPKKIVVHAMGEYIHITEDSKNYFKTKMNLDLEVRDYPAAEWLRIMGYSAHLLITPSGEAIRCRDNDQGAYHAKGYNTDSLGVEFLVEGAHDITSLYRTMNTPWVTGKQRIRGLKEVKIWMEEFTIRKDHIFTHQELSPQRKKDPGSGFGFNTFIADL
jgi:N-acetyl-anhydromuramyl-L-alanine amidase AmpD